MLRNQMIDYVKKELTVNTLDVYKEEKEYIEKNKLVDNDIQLKVKDAALRFSDAYIERSDKESEELLAEESNDFLKQPLDYLKTHKNEFIYLESKWFELINVETISLEVDDVFGTYDVMLGLKLQKKFGPVIKTYVNSALNGESVKYNLLFSGDEGVWNFNFPLNHVEGFHEDLSIGEAFQLIYSFLFTLAEAAEEGK
ncbi:branched-chain amino acid aminotransferase [Peribacillus psychrosaccharolyticus]|uniref:Branched-chain amino acid aminotransferase n=1 Tax=Peribacillus psychrosaccharolyticus TaxID=1407 RepID=A0A974S0Z9_PERPY|nr:branched-chain amino acid aminotransferase [Peribacillus psychrosaccharolyticus]MEC2057316.1 branched-chain amino acid aminotransferase [Peribacillus psychrosaccharolyticus]MED3742857.1 branched-chain amino acid aminotransferase [Peribacillus psychrosaccharolyticus]QQT01074.1 branched-chain amino acid aminotransferase [Peribacillus psychrosaccharolyticus]